MHMMTASETDPVIENDGEESKEKLMQISGFCEPLSSFAYSSSLF